MTQQPAADPFPPAPVPSAQPAPDPAVLPWGRSPVRPGFPSPVPPAPPSGQWQPERVVPVPGTEFGLIQIRVVPITSGLAIGSLVAGIAAILVSFLVLCFGLTGSQQGWGGWVSGAFALLSVVAGGGAVALGLVGRRQIRSSGLTGQVRFTGRGLAVAGIVCGSAGAGIALLCLTFALVLQASA